MQSDMFITLQAPFIGWPIIMAMKVLAQRLEEQSTQSVLNQSFRSELISMSLLLEVLDVIEDQRGFWHTSVETAVIAMDKFRATQENQYLDRIIQGY